MSTMSKRHKENVAKLELGRKYSLEEAVRLLLDMRKTKFNESVDVHLRLGVDPKKAEQAVRGTVVLPHGTGKKVRILVFATGTDVDAAKAAGADIVGLEDVVKKVQDGWTDFDIAIATPATMREVGKLGKVLGPRGLMPSPKAGTVTQNVAEAVKEFKAGKVEFRIDKQSGVHCVVGKVTFSAEQLIANLQAFLAAVFKARPPALKGAYLQRLAIATSMGPGIHIDPRDVEHEEAE